jgi:hypothetical protein
MPSIPPRRFVGINNIGVNLRSSAFAAGYGATRRRLHFLQFP